VGLPRLVLEPPLDWAGRGRRKGASCTGHFESQVGSSLAGSPQSYKHKPRQNNIITQLPLDNSLVGGHSLSVLRRRSGGSWLILWRIHQNFFHNYENGKKLG